jgi:glycosyl transferase family 2
MKSSIVIPCYNGARFLPFTFESLFSQTRPADEVILVDDGSTDESAEIAARAGPSVTVIRQKNQGESVARNVGLKAAHGDYVLFLDADDMLAPESLERLMTAVQTAPGSIAVMGCVLFTGSLETTIERHTPQMTGFFPGIIQTNFGPPHCWFVPRTLALGLGGFREDLIHSEDWEFWARVALTEAPLVTVPYEGALYRKHPHSQVETSPRPEVDRGRLLVCETLAQGILERPQLFENVGEVLFWSLWAMIGQARRSGVATAKLQNAERLLQEVARRGPNQLRHSISGMAVRFLGARRAHRLRDLFVAS